MPKGQTSRPFNANERRALRTLQEASDNPTQRNINAINSAKRTLLNAFSKDLNRSKNASFERANLPTSRTPLR